MRMNRLRKTILSMLFVMAFGFICIGYMISIFGWSNGYPFWMNDYPIVYIPFSGWLISACFMFYYMFTLAKESTNVEEGE